MALTQQMLSAGTQRKGEKLTIDQQKERLAAMRQLARFRRAAVTRNVVKLEDIPF